MGAFGPSETGGAGVSAGLDDPLGGEILDPEMVLRIAYGKYPSPWIARLLDVSQ